MRGVNGIKTDFIFRDIPFHRPGQIGVEFFSIPGAVEQENAAFFEVFDHLVFVHIRRVVAGDKVRLVYIVS